MFNQKLLSVILLGLTTHTFAKLPIPDAPIQQTHKTQQTAQTINRSNNTYSTITDNIQKKYQEDQAARWGITEQEWLKFEEIKKGPRGYWSPQLDPLTTLGIEAETEAERQHYAELQVQMEFNRAEKELAYQRAYTAAFKRLYPNRLPIENLGKAKITNGAMSMANSQRLSVFVKQNCAACDKQIKELHKANANFDIYMVDSNNDDNVIRQWATRSGINPKKVLNKSITLNHGANLWKKIGKETDKLPITYLQVNGQLVRQH